MVQIAHEQTPRVSQVLPTVKCSSCGQPVPLVSLGDHVCPPLPPPNLLALQKPPMSPKSAATLLPQRLQPLAARSNTPPRQSSSGKPSEEREWLLAPSHDPFQRPSPDKSHMAFPMPNISSPRDRDPAARTPPPPDRTSIPARDPIPPSLQRVRTPSNTSRFPPISPSRPAFPVPLPESAVRPALRRDPTPPTQQLIAPLRHPLPNRPSPNAAPSPGTLRDPSIPVRTSSAASTSRPSVDISRVSLDHTRPLDVRRPPINLQHPSTQRNPSTSPGLATPPPALAKALLPVSASILPPASTRQPPPPPLSIVPHDRIREIDTKTGGEAGMAGVGRRGFAAAARAAMLAATLSPSHPPLHGTPYSDGYRPNPPQYLGTDGTFAHVMRAVMTPPLSPNSVHTPSPVSPVPVSPVSPGNGTRVSGQHPNLPSPHDGVFRPSPTISTSNDKLPPLSPSGIRIASPSRSPSPIPNPFERRVSGETITQSPMSSASLSLPFLDAFKPELDHGNESDDESVYTTHSDQRRDTNSLLSPSADSDVGLAYAEDSDDDMPVVMPLDVRKSAVNGTTNKVKFPTSPSLGQKHAPGPSRQTSNMSLRSTMSSRSGTSATSTVRSRSASATTQGTARSNGALERAMETLIEEGASVSVLASGSVLASIGGYGPSRGSGKPSRSNTVPGPASPEWKPPKLPTRSHTNPSHPHVHSERVGLIGEVARIRNQGSTKRKDKICAGCDFKIEDGRWIQMDGGSVLCERCWKNMYLPKCRRCNLTIEKQAVSSRDGQLKGKYHKECFNCHTCQKPFPDKEFYVFDGKPFCAYHYHEVNNSLCGAHSCGQPIEGPCAVTHSGKRYHPEHLLCEFEDGCKEKLEEYWEVDGQMLCERHATFIGNRDSSWTRGSDPISDTQTRAGVDEGRMMKRMTRFIDLGGGGDDELDIR